MEHRPERSERTMWLVVVALFGLFVPNGLFIYWVLYDFQSVGLVFENHLAVAFILDALITLILLAIHFAKAPPGRYGWGWFVALSLIGGLCFGLPFYWWLNQRPGARIG